MWSRWAITFRPAPVVPGTEIAVGLDPVHIRVKQRLEQLSLVGPVGEVTVLVSENLFLTGHCHHLPSEPAQPVAAPAGKQLPMLLLGDEALAKLSRPVRRSGRGDRTD